MPKLDNTHVSKADVAKFGAHIPEANAAKIDTYISEANVAKIDNRQVPEADAAKNG